MRQDLVTRKNQKVRRLRELHPEIAVRLLYRSDYANVLAKMGLPPANYASDHRQHLAG